MRSVLITGASTGIGRATAMRLDGAGWRVFAGFRKQADADSLREEGGPNLVPVSVDVTEPDQIAAAAEFVSAATGGTLDGLVNNAGAALPAPLETVPIDDFRRQIELNLIAQVAVTQRMLPAIRAGSGRIVFLSSIGGRFAVPFLGGYHASKFGIEAVGDVFRQELRPWKIPVSLIEPGSIDTPIWERGLKSDDEIRARSDSRFQELYGDSVESYREAVISTAERGIPAEKVAEAIEHALTARRPKARYLVGLDAKAQARIKHVVPTRAMDAIVARMLGQ